MSTFGSLCITVFMCVSACIAFESGHNPNEFVIIDASNGERNHTEADIRSIEDSDYQKNKRQDVIIQEKRKESDFEHKNTDERNTSIWNLKFDPSYFASLNAANHRPVPESLIKSKNDSSGDSSTFYYSPEAYGKQSHKNHQNLGYSFKYPQPKIKQVTTTSPVLTLVKPTLFAGRGVNTESNSSNSDDESPSKETNNSDMEQEKLSINENERKPAPDGEHYEDQMVYDALRDHLDDKWYYQPMSSRVRDKVSKKPLWLQEIISSSSPNGEYNDEDYEATEPYSDFKHFGDVKKSYVKHKYGSGSAYYNPYYSAPYYAATQSYPAIIGDDVHRHQNDLKGFHSWSGLAGFLLGVIPLGILMASLVPAFVSIPVATATAGIGRKRRNVIDDMAHIVKYLNESHTFYEIYNHPLVNVFTKYNAYKVEQPNCLQEALCETIAKNVKRGSIFDAVFQSLVSWSPRQLTALLGIDTFITAIKERKCNAMFPCQKPG